MIDTELIINFKYYKWYCNIIRKSNDRKFKRNAGLARHHIIPRSFDGSYDKTNIAILTEREHFVCHVLLVKMLKPSVYRNKMLTALNMMRTNNRYFNSRLYEKHREEFKQSRREYYANLSREQKQELSDNRKKLLRENPEIIEKIRNAAIQQDRSNMELGKRGLKGEDRTEKQKLSSKSHSENSKGRIPWNKGISATIPAWNIGRKCPELGVGGKIEYTCPHCGKLGQGNSMKRWHFDNCKNGN